MANVTLVQEPVYGLPSNRARITRYRSAVLNTPGLINFWPFRELAPPYTDIVGGLVLSAVGTVLTVRPGVVPGGDGSFYSAGSGSVKTSSFAGWPSQFTIEGWVDGANGNTAMIGNWNGSSGVLMYLTGAGIRFYTASSFIDSGYVIVPGSPAHVVGSWDGTNRRIYVNGTLRAGPTGGSSPGNGNPLELGNYSNTSGAYFSGKIDEVAIYNRVLGDAEVLSHYRQVF